MTKARVGRSLLVLSFVALGGCKTTLPKEEPETVFVPAPAPEPSRAEVPAASNVEVAAPPNIFLEPVQPVRGGAAILPPYLGPDPCQMALLGESPVAKACSKGGKRAAIELMQTFVSRAKAEGIEFGCVDCHVDEDDYTHLKPQADVEFRKLLFLARPE